MTTHIIRAKMKVQVNAWDQLNWYRFADLDHFESNGGEIGIYRTFQWKDKLPYKITLEHPDSHGWHFIEAVREWEEPMTFVPLLLIKTSCGALSYNYLTKPVAYDANGEELPVYYS